MPSTVMVSHCAPVVCQSMWGSMQAQGVKSTKCRHLTAQTPRWGTRTEKYTSIAKGTELHRNGPKKRDWKPFGAGCSGRSSTPAGAGGCR